jgi:plastocyanin
MKIGRHSQFAICALAILVSGLAVQRQALAAQFGEASPSTQGGKLLGRVSVTGGHEAPRPLKVFKSRKFCGATVPNETLLVGTGGGLRNAVITLRPLDRSATALPGRVVLDNKRCAFVPHVQVATAGSELSLKNSDPILHTVHARMGKETLFNVGLPTWRQVTKRLDQPGVVRIDCDVLHTWMSAAIMVVTTPYFSVTDASGTIAFEDLPAGAYEMEVWHERLGLKKTRVSLQENGVVNVDVVFGVGGGRPDQ